MGSGYIDVPFTSSPPPQGEDWGEGTIYSYYGDSISSPADESICRNAFIHEFTAFTSELSGAAVFRMHSATFVTMSQLHE